MVDWSDTIVLRLKNKRKVVFPRSVIKHLGVKPDRDYTGGAAKDIETTFIHVELMWARDAGFSIQHSDIRDTCIGIDLDMEFKVVLGLLRGDKAAEVLFD